MQWDLLFTYRAWAIETGFFERIYPVVMEMMRTGAPISKLRSLNPGRNKADRLKLADYDAGTGLYLFSAAQSAENSQKGGRTDNKIAYIPIIGSLSKRGDLCSFGMKDYQGWINAALRSEEVAGIVLEIESPGGTVDGTMELGRTIRDANKPIVAFGDGMVASAAYWLASQTDKIYGNENNYVDFGSIGTLYVYQNWAKYIENEVGEVRIIRAPQSKDKALINPFEPLPEAQEKEIKNELKEITDFFVSAVKEGRGDRLTAKDEEIFTGKMFSKEIALDKGLIDAIGTLQDAIDEAFNLSTEKNGQSAQNSNKQSEMKLSKISSLFGKAEEEAKTEELSAEERASLEAADTKLTEMEEQLTTLQTQNADLQKQIDTLKTEKSGLEAQVSEKDTTIEELNGKLEKAPAGAATTTVADKDHDPDEGKKKDDYRTDVDDEADKYRSLVEEPGEKQKAEK